MEHRNLSEDKIYCMVYNSGLKCPPDCKFQHLPDQKRKVQKLYNLGLYVKLKTGLLRPKQEDLNNFYSHLFTNKICVKFYLLGDCPYVAGDRCWYHHISIQDQKHKLKPKVPQDIIKKDEDHQKNNFTDWQTQKCRYGAFCQKKNMGCPFSHEEDVTPFEKNQNEKQESSDIEEKNEEIEGEKEKKEEYDDSKNEDQNDCENSEKNNEDDDEEEEEIKKAEIIVTKGKNKSKDKEKNKEKEKEIETEKNKKETEKNRKEIEKNKKETENLKKEKKNKERETEKEKETPKERAKPKEKEKTKGNTSSLEKEMEDSGDSDAKESVKCQKCKQRKKQNTANCLFLPCGHQYFCVECAQEVFLILGKKCSLCFKEVDFIKIKN